MLEMDSTEIALYGEQEQSAYNGHFESTCYHSLVLFNDLGDCLGATGGFAQTHPQQPLMRRGADHASESPQKMIAAHSG